MAKEPKPENVLIGGRIRLARKRAELTQGELAARIGADGQTISKLERGVFGPSLSTAGALGRVLSVTAEWILNGDEASAVSKPPPQPRYPDVWARAVQLGYLDRWREQGASDVMIEQVMTNPYKGNPSPRDLDRSMQDLILDEDAPAPGPMVEARRANEDAGRPDLGDLIEPPADDP